MKQVLKVKINYPEKVNFSSFYHPFRCETKSFYVDHVEDESEADIVYNNIYDYRDKPISAYENKDLILIPHPLYNKKVNDSVMLNLNTTMAYAQGDPAGIVSDVGNSYALGFSVGAQYKVVEDHQLSLNIRQPLRVESSKLETTNFIADLAPSGRQVNYVFGYNYQVTKKSGIVTELSYVDDINHVHSTSDYRAMIKYRITL